MAKHLATILLGGVQVLGRAFARALQNEIRASQQAAQSRAGTRSTTESTATNAVTGMTLKEAMDILNVKSLTDKEAIQSRYEHLFKMNDKSMGGTLYLQSKVVRAKERIEAEISSLEKEAKG